MDKKILRVIDANFNRSKEGLRVAEDIFRFVIEDDHLRKKIRKIRHSLDVIAKSKIIKNSISTRDSRYDLGKETDPLELERKNCIEILYINLQRVKESLRVLEEFLKIIVPARVSQIKKIRYEVYTLEKKITLKLSSLTR